MGSSTCTLDKQLAALDQLREELALAHAQTRDAQQAAEQARHVQAQAVSQTAHEAAKNARTEWRIVGAMTIAQQGHSHQHVQPSGRSH